VPAAGHLGGREWGRVAVGCCARHSARPTFEAHEWARALIVDGCGWEKGWGVEKGAAVRFEFLAATGRHGRAQGLLPRDTLRNTLCHALF